MLALNASSVINCLQKYLASFAASGTYVTPCLRLPPPLAAETPYVSKSRLSSRLKEHFRGDPVRSRSSLPPPSDFLALCFVGVDGAASDRASLQAYVYKTIQLLLLLYGRALGII